MQVYIDLGRQTNEIWVLAKVLERYQTEDLFDPDLTHENLFVEIPGGERLHVSHWVDPKDMKEHP